MFDPGVAQQCCFMAGVCVSVCTRVLWSWHKSTLHRGCLDCPETPLSPDLHEQSEAPAGRFLSRSERAGFLPRHAEHRACLPARRDLLGPRAVPHHPPAPGAHLHQAPRGLTQSVPSRRVQPGWQKWRYVGWVFLQMLFQFASISASPPNLKSGVCFLQCC